MTCDRVQAELSRVMDEREALGSETAAHLLACDECGDFRVASIEMSRRYAQEVRAGIDRLRRLEGAVPSRKPGPPLRWLVSLAAAALLCWLGMGKSRVEPPAPQAPVVALAGSAPVPPATRGHLFGDRLPFDEAASFILDFQPRLPVRLDQEFLPAAPEPVEINLPRSLRF
jgi:hypothetical protein